MVSGIVSFSGSLLDHESFSIASATSFLGIDIILPIVASWKTAFSVLEIAPADVARQRSPTSLFELFEQVVGFLGRCCERGRRLDLARRADSGVDIQRSVTEVGSGDGDRRRQAERAQLDKKTDEPNPSPLKGEHRLFFLGKTLA